MITDGGRRGMNSKNETEQRRHYKYSIRDDAYRTILPLPSTQGEQILYKLVLPSLEDTLASILERP